MEMFTIVSQKLVSWKEVQISFQNFMARRDGWVYFGLPFLRSVIQTYIYCSKMNRPNINHVRCPTYCLMIVLERTGCGLCRCKCNQVYKKSHQSMFKEIIKAIIQMRYELGKKFIAGKVQFDSRITFYS